MTFVMFKQEGKSALMLLCLFVLLQLRWKFYKLAFVC